MDKLLTIRVVLIAIAFLLAAFGVHHAFLAVFSQGRFEVIYRFDETVRLCTGEYCAYSAEFALANTGEAEQQRITVTLSGIPDGIGGTPHVINLSALEPRDADPGIKSDQSDGDLRYHITGLASGTLVSIRLSGFYPVSAAPSKPPSVSVSARGRVIEGDPRAVTLGRILIGFAQLTRKSEYFVLSRTVAS